MTALTTSQRGDMMGDLGIKNTQIVSVSGFPTGGTFKLTYQGQITVDIAFNATADVVQSALEALSTIGAGNVTVLADLPGGPFTIFLYGGLSQVPFLTTNNLTGGTAPALTVRQLIVFSDSALQRLYDRAANDTSQFVYERAIAYGYRQLWGASKTHDVRTMDDAASLNSITTHFEAQYKLWASASGLHGGVLVMGTFSYSIDEPYSVSEQAAIDAYLAVLRSA